MEKSIKGMSENLGGGFNARRCGGSACVFEEFPVREHV
jgi:hypothetical protein